MAKMNDLTIRVDDFFTQSRVNYCNTVNCANRKNMEIECNLKEIFIEDGKCHSMIKQDRNDIIPIKP